MIRTASRLVIALLLLAASSVTEPAVALAAPESDIPGVPLPGPTATGLLGGPIYDVVYRLTVQPGYVIVAGLTGTAGTDFDIYLFDSTATTVVLNTGLLAKSTGPTSDEQVAYPSAYGGTYYIDLNGASDVEGTYTLTVQVVKDTLAPTASLLLANGRAATDSTTVDVTLTASGSLSGVSQMAFSPDGITFGAWQPYTVASTWTFPPGDGVKALWAKVRNGVGTESAVVGATVVLDTVPPTANVILPTPNTAVAGLRPTFVVGFSEPIDVASWLDHGLVVQAASGQAVGGSYTYGPRSQTGEFVPSGDLVPGAPYIVTIGAVRDVAGNVIAPPGSWIVTPLLPTELALEGGPSPITPGAPVGLDGTVAGADVADLALEARPGGSTDFAPADRLVVIGGEVATTVRPQLSTTYRLSYVGSPTTAAATSNEVTILVRRGVALAGVSSSVTRTVKAGSRATLTAQVTPAGGGAHLSFRRYRYDAARRAYVYAGSYGRTTDATGRVSLTWSTTAGRWYWRVAALSSPQYANNISPVYRWTVVP